MPGAPTPLSIGVGAVTNFLDTLGIGSFATTTAMFRFFKMVPDRIIPGTLNAGHTLPTIVQAFFYISVIPVDVVTLISMIAAAVAGAWLGAGIVAGWSKRNVQFGMGFALLARGDLLHDAQPRRCSPPARTRSASAACCWSSRSPATSCSAR